MADGTKISWTDATWNVITGCDVLSPGCTNCYAMRLAGTRLKHHQTREGLTKMTKTGPVWNGEVRFNEHLLDQPLGWRNPRRIFVVAHGDLFYLRVRYKWVDAVLAIAALCPQHTFQILTKRADLMWRYFVGNSRAPMSKLPEARVGAAAMAIARGRGEDVDDPYWDTFWQWPLPNVLLGFSAEDQKHFDERWEHVRKLAAAGWKTWCSAEPLLGPIDARPALAREVTRRMGQHNAAGLWDEGDYAFPNPEQLRWMVTGDESRQNKPARLANPDWHRVLRDQCVAAGVPFHLKQMMVDGKLVKEPFLDGRQWLQFPEIAT